MYVFRYKALDPNAQADQRVLSFRQMAVSSGKPKLATCFSKQQVVDVNRMYLSALLAFCIFLALPISVQPGKDTPSSVGYRDYLAGNWPSEEMKVAYQKCPIL
ncbi:hypothetical protein HOLleu_07464 [Holothuria leucospilota]|uniref:Uncharacterized protein n=1 Tax=Holothuria leucospilota TaxID=206669 RepID=A0A9Q1HG49_HOLLE|nr:hypothetical protein HOLleu_07464 [Holothuria leucospilota]